MMINSIIIFIVLAYLAIWIGIEILSFMAGIVIAGLWGICLSFLLIVKLLKYVWEVA